MSQSTITNCQCVKNIAICNVTPCSPLYYKPDVTQQYNQLAMCEEYFHM